MDLYGSEKTALQILSTDHSLQTQTQTMCARHDAMIFRGPLGCFPSGPALHRDDVTSSCRTLASMPSQVTVEFERLRVGEIQSRSSPGGCAASAGPRESAQSASVTYLSDYSSVILALSADFEEDSESE